MEDAGVDHETLLDTCIRAINVITQDRPNDLTIGLHMCRGNYIVTCIPSLNYLVIFTETDQQNLQGVHFTEGSYARIAFKVFNRLDVDVFYVRKFLVWFLYCKDLCLKFLNSSSMIQNESAILRR